MCGLILRAALMRLPVAILSKRRRRCRLFAARFARRTRFPALARRGLVALAPISATTAAAAIPAAAGTLAMLAIASRDGFALRDRWNDRIAGLSRVERSTRLARSALLLSFTLIVALTVALPITLTFALPITPAVPRFAARALTFLITALLRCTPLSTGLAAIALALTLTFALTFALPVAAIRTSGLTAPTTAVTLVAASTTPCISRRFTRFRSNRRRCGLRWLGTEPAQHFVEPVFFPGRGCRDSAFHRHWCRLRRSDALHHGFLPGFARLFLALAHGILLDRDAPPCRSWRAAAPLIEVIVAQALRPCSWASRDACWAPAARSP